MANTINPYIEDDGYISKEHWNSYVECEDDLEPIGYIVATTAITNRLDSLVKQQKEHSLPMEVFLEAIEKIVFNRKELISHANKMRGYEL